MLKSFRQLNNKTNYYKVRTVNTDTLEIQQYYYTIHKHNNIDHIIKFGIFTTHLENTSHNNANEYIDHLKQFNFEEFDITELNNIPLLKGGYIK